jgi:hypothetical protein
MPPRFSYWTIIAGGLPTAFRAAEREELLPTFTRLKEKQPDAEMKWFARGKLWNSPEEARGDRDRSFGRDDRGGQRRSGPPHGGDATPRRGRDWRPGGDHRDPRQPFKDAKKDRNQRIKAEKFARKTGREDLPRERPHGDPLAPDRRSRHDGSRQGAGPGRKPWTRDAEGGKSPAWRPPPPAADRDSRRTEHRNTEYRDRDAKRPPRPRPSGSSRDWNAKPLREKPHGDKLTRPSRSQAYGSSRDWNAKPPREKPHGDKLTRPPHPRHDRDREKSFRPREESRWTNKARDEGRGTFRGQGHGDNTWKARPPRDERSMESTKPRPFAPRAFERERKRGTNSGEPPSQPPRRPNPDPRPNENPAPSPPPRPSEPIVPPPGPPERGRLNRDKRRR